MYKMDPMSFAHTLGAGNVGTSTDYMPWCISHYIKSEDRMAW